MSRKLSRKEGEGDDEGDDDDGVGEGEGGEGGEYSKGSTCCIVVVREKYNRGFIRKYNKKHWVDRTGQVLPQKCFVFAVNFSDRIRGTAEYKTREEHASSGLHPATPEDLIELHPPPEMPQGNTGTPTQRFHALIRSCQLPSIVIKKLGLQFPKSRGRKRFSQVPFDYGTSVEEGRSQRDDESVAFTASGHHIPSSYKFTKPHGKRKGKTKRPRMELEEEGEDGAEVEEWERYEAFHEDVTSQGRIKERRYEEEMEVTWEKGGPGLVFYTDSQYWRQQEGDFDEQTADEWDVDMSVYYEEGGGDKDARDGIDMLHSDKLRAGSLTQSAFTAHTTAHTRTTAHTSTKRARTTAHTSTKHTTKHTTAHTTKHTTKKKRSRIGPTAPPQVGKFEEHTRGFGRRVMEAQGWKDGQGLGRSEAGLPYALENDGQHPLDKKGLGYHGEKLQGWGVTRTENTQQRQQRQRKQQIGPRLISTVFDAPDPPPPTLRTSEPTTLSHRPTHVNFIKSTDDTADS